MLFFNADPRDGGMGAGSICQPCCCQPIRLKPGETNLVIIDYSAWVLPIGWIVPTTEFSITQDESTCSPTGLVADDYSTTGTSFPTPVESAIPLEPLISGGTEPYTYQAPLPFSGPQHGKVQAIVTTPGQYKYTPVAGYKGYDYFDYKVIDANGMEAIGTVSIQVAGANGGSTLNPDPKRTSEVPYVSPRSVQVDDRLMLIRFPIYMPTDCQGCDSYQMLIKQPAKDCDGNVYNHVACFNISCKDC